MANDPLEDALSAPEHWEQVVDDLIEQAAVSLDELVEGQQALTSALGIAPFGLDDTVEMDAVHTIRRLAAALSAIADGEDEPASIARKALDAGL
jgi:hypothetical protein